MGHYVKPSPASRAVFFLRQPLTREWLAEQVRSSAPDGDPLAVDSMLRLLRAASEVMSALDEMLAAYGLTRGRYATLLHLVRGPERGLMPSELANLANVTRATMTGLIDGLVRDGLVHRRTSRSDRRMAFVTITERGRAIREQSMPNYFRIAGRIMHGLSAGDREQFNEMLGRIVNGVGRVHAAAAEETHAPKGGHASMDDPA